MRRSFDRATLTPLREMPSEDALALLAIYFKADPTYIPVIDSRSRRWHVCTACGEFEIVTTGPNKWYDTRAKKGGGGGIDLAMHVLHVPFVDAVRYLIQHGNSHG